MLDNIDITKILFFDIETVPGAETHDALDETWKGLWAHKAQSILRKTAADMTESDASDVYNRAGIYAEFGKIICISAGFIALDKTTSAYKARVKSFANDDEKILLQDFSAMMNKSYNDTERQFLCGHNIREFDVPYISRRLMINQLPLPKMFEVAGKKPWEVKHLIDTMELWKFGDLKSFTSLKLLAAALGFPSPKEDIDGSDVHRVYYEEKDLPRIAKYCEKDVIAVMRLLMKYKLMPDELHI